MIICTIIHIYNIVKTREAAAAAFVGYELSISKTFIDPAIIEKYLSSPSVLIPFAVMEVCMSVCAIT